MRTTYDINQIPVSHRHDVKKALEILKDVGCQEVYIFGSLVNGPVTPKSDIDLAVKGIPPESFFKVFGKLIMQLDHPVDLIDLEEDNRFANMLQREGYLRRVN
ncbi:MAG: nucleotidyltransferase domain-containing protein [Candidatus Aminicenantes bacterium]|nr:MAG: nucleotidyltransferase domain-containing protein [Candidatus Aminicenantes bacterium]